MFKGSSPLPHFNMAPCHVPQMPFPMAHHCMGPADPSLFSHRSFGRLWHAPDVSALRLRLVELGTAPANSREVTRYRGCPVHGLQPAI